MNTSSYEEVPEKNTNKEDYNHIFLYDRINTNVINLASGEERTIEIEKTSDKIINWKLNARFDLEKNNAFVEEVKNIAGVEWGMAFKYKMHLRIGKLFSWNEVEKQLKSLFEKYEIDFWTVSEDIHLETEPENEEITKFIWIENADGYFHIKKKGKDSYYMGVSSDAFTNKWVPVSKKLYDSLELELLPS